MVKDERSALLPPPKRQGHKLGTVEVARLVTFSSSFSEGWEIAIFALILLPVTEEFGLTTTELVLLASLPMAAGLIGYLLIGWCMDMVGRRPMIIASYIICCAGCSVMALAPGVFMLGVGRGILALGIRSGIACVSVYMSEISPAGKRGTLVSIEEIYINIGILSATFTAWVLMGMELVTWRVFVGIGAIAPALACLGMLLLRMPESPRFLQLWGMKEEAAEVLRSALDGDEDEISRTLSLWKEDDAGMSQKTWTEHLKEVQSLPSHKGFRMATCCWIARSGSGMIIVGTYYGLLMRDLGEEGILRWFTIGQFMKTVAIIPSVFCFIDKVGRRPLFLASAVACFCSMSAAAVSQLSGAPLVVTACCIVAYLASFSVGYGPVVWAYCFEILPSAQRGRASVISMMFGDLFSGVLLIAGPYLIEMHKALPYGVLAVTNMMAAAFFFYACPETSGMLLETAGKACTPGRDMS